MASAKRTQRATALLFAACALAEIVTGAVLLVFPRVASWLLDAPLEATGLLVVRALGSALLALGITWWMLRNDAQAVAGCRVGFIIYNLVVGALFAYQALHVARPLWPSLAGAVHLLAGVAFVAMNARNAVATRTSG
jgi:hypothetical protein